MAASGRVAAEVLELMGQTVTIGTSSPHTTLYGKRVGSTTRSVQCLIEPAMSASRTHEANDVTYSYDIYCDDVDIVETDVVTLPDGTTPPINSIETYNDEHGALYQVVHC